jgi:hypothetical protein
MRPHGGHLVAQRLPSTPLPPDDHLPGVLGQRVEHRRGRIERRRARLAGLAAALIRGRSAGLGDLRGQAHPEGAHHRTHIRQLPCFQRGQKRGLIAIAGIRYHQAEGHAPPACPVDQANRQLRLRLKGDRLRDARPSAAGWVGGPALGQIELGTHRPLQRVTPLQSVFHILGADQHLAVPLLAQGARVLPRHPHRGPALLGQPRVVQNQHAARWTARHQVAHPRLVQRQRVPAGIGEQ